MVMPSTSAPNTVKSSTPPPSAQPSTKSPPDMHTKPGTEAELPEETTNPFPWNPDKKIVEDGPGATKSASDMVQNYNPYDADIVTPISEVDRETTLIPGPDVDKMKAAAAKSKAAAAKA